MLAKHTEQRLYASERTLFDFINKSIYCIIVHGF